MILKTRLLIAFTLLLMSAQVTAQNVGIGTASPLQELEVDGTIRSTDLAGTGLRTVFATADGDLTVTGAAADSWLLVGNAGTTAATNFLGTTDAIDLVFRTNNTEHARITSSGRVVVNRTTPSIPSTILSSHVDAGNDAALGAFAIAGAAPGASAFRVFCANGTNSLGILSQHFGDGIPLSVAGNLSTESVVVDISNLGALNTLPTVRIQNINTGNSPAIAINQNHAGSSFLTLQTGDARGVEVQMAAGTSNSATSLFNLGTAPTLSVQQGNLANNAPAILASNFNTTANFDAIAVQGQSLDGIRAGVFVAGLDAGAVVLPPAGLTTGRSIALIGAAGSTPAAATSTIGVFGNAVGTSGYGVVGGGSAFGVFAIGDVGASGVKPFVIDHPEDPENKYLRHFSIESDEVLNYYRGRAEFDASGVATIQLESYVELVGRSFEYMLTPVGAAMPNLYVSREVANGQFEISGGVPGKSVSWVVTAERNDPYLQQKPQHREVVVDKPAIDRGKYQHPELYGQPESKRMFANELPDREKLRALEQQPQQIEQRDPVRDSNGRIIKTERGYELKDPTKE